MFDPVPDDVGTIEELAFFTFEDGEGMIPSVVICLLSDQLRINPFMHGCLSNIFQGHLCFPTKLGVHGFSRSDSDLKALHLSA